MCDTGEDAHASSLERARGVAAGGDDAELHVASRHECWECDAWCKSGLPICAAGNDLGACGLVCVCLGCLVLIVTAPACAQRSRMRHSYVALVTARQLVTTEEIVDPCGKIEKTRTESLSVANIAAVEAQSDCCCGSSTLSIFLNNERGERRTKKDCCGNYSNAPADSTVSCLEDAFKLAGAIEQAKKTVSQAGHERRATGATATDFRVGRAAISGTAKETRNPMGNL